MRFCMFLFQVLSYLQKHNTQKKKRTKEKNTKKHTSLIQFHIKQKHKERYENTYAFWGHG